MKVYHGSYMKVDKIDLSKSKPNKDFGKGFYVTLNPQVKKIADRETLFENFTGQNTVRF